MALPKLEDVWRWLAEVPDPEIPVVSLLDLGIVRDVAFEGEVLVVAITPTYSGCPATSVIALDVENALRSHGVEKLRVERRLSPAWTTDWITPEAREKLRAYGIAPPIDGTAIGFGAKVGTGFAEPKPSTERSTGQRRASALGSNMVVACPRCGSGETEKVSHFGSTPCKAQFRCRACHEPFDYFKCH